MLFADVAGCTAWCERHDPEEVLAVTDRCLSSLGEIVERLGGFVARVIGDELMARLGAWTEPRTPYAVTRGPLLEVVAMGEVAGDRAPGVWEAGGDRRVILD